ncbi:hypothetical protein Dsin_008667 [Dipteronia sinensis]|uniref:Uncharacterized protein n=1 Tax=Dipteronia sinensis TaxID=43782 RepID=A0AAE0APG8_9ROSI|nr:hypothetical protein Dsin_008667 [Dipteronia sinensis]
MQVVGEVMEEKEIGTQSTKSRSRALKNEVSLSKCRLGRPRQTSRQQLSRPKCRCCCKEAKEEEVSLSKCHLGRPRLSQRHEVSLSKCHLGRQLTNLATATLANQVSLLLSLKLHAEWKIKHRPGVVLSWTTATFMLAIARLHDFLG